MSKSEEWTVEDEDGNQLTLTVSLTGEGVVFGAFDEDGIVFSESMTAQEWFEWMQARDYERKFKSMNNKES